MKILIVDDEFDSRRILRKYLSEDFDEIELFEASSITEAEIIVKEENPVIILLDIQLNGSLSFDLFNKLDYKNVNVIFITAYEQYALKAFEFGAINYLLKPIDREKLIESIERFSSKKGATIIQESKNKSQNFEKIIIRDEKGIRFIEVTNIAYIIAEGSYCKIINGGKSSELIVKPLKYISDKLAEHPHFLRLHKSYMINLNYVKNFSSDFSNVTLFDGTIIPISRAKKDEIKDFLNENFY